MLKHIDFNNNVEEAIWAAAYGSAFSDSVNKKYMDHIKAYINSDCLKDLLLNNADKITKQLIEPMYAIEKTSNKFAIDVADAAVLSYRESHNEANNANKK